MNRSIPEIAAMAEVTEGAVRNVIRAKSIKPAAHSFSGELYFDESSIATISVALWPPEPAAEHGRMTIPRGDICFL